MVAAFADGTAIGLAFGYALPANARWWQGLTTPVDKGFTDENGCRTFALNELMVVPEWQGKGVAHALHDDLLGGRPEERATLLVREDNDAAQNAYTRWGWRKIGKLQPYPDAPNFDAMILPLRVES
ncbi:GNAT family N-acetyltransferase [Actinophytocola sp.]|uniref:GNAT family N-acetyltransferase n=1 Tax=Actinophytocola sp. TaxID=1872138 RepID=UPI002ED04349